MLAPIDVDAPVPRDVLTARIAGLQEWMAEQGLDALVVFSAGSNLGTATKSHGHLRYLLDWGGDVAPSAAVVPKSGMPALVVANIFLRLLGEEHGWLPVRLGRGGQFARAIVESLPHGASRIGLVGREEMPFGLWEPLARAGADRWRDCTGEIERRRLIKDPVQAAYHRRAAAICDEMFARLGPELRSGKAVFQIQAELERIGHDRGCEFSQTWLTVGPVVDRPRYWRHENAHLPREGEQVALGIMLQYQGHWAHAIRTGALGEPTPAAREVFGVIERMHAGMLEHLSPGKDLRQCSDTGEAIVNDYLERGKRPPHFRFRNAHGMGHSYEDPIVSAVFPQPYDSAGAPPSATPVQPGMLFEIHPNLFIPGRGGASLGDTVLVGEEGPEILTRFPPGLSRF
jgi:Xaa-Pro aminopeptidase